MKKMFLIFSHILTEEQKQNAKEELKIDEFISLPEKLQKLWSDVPPDIDFPFDIANQIIKFLKENSKNNDVVLIQGDFGLSFYIVDWCINNKLIPVYSTTKRDIINEKSKNGKVKKTLIFKHVKFRRYRRAV